MRSIIDTRTSLAGIIGAFLGFLFTFTIARSLSRRVTAINDVASAVAVDPSLPRTVPEGRDDEIGVLARSFNTMLEALRTAHREVEIRVRDNGIGIKPAFLPHLFDRFQQADTSQTRTQGGLGLGLAIAKELVELHGGTISVETAGPDQGTTFIVRLPLRLRA